MPSTPTALLEVRNLGKAFYLHARNTTVPSCRGVDLDLYPGRLTALVGPTGAGKSSVLRCIWRSYRPGSGSIWYRRRDGSRINLATASDADMLRLRRDEIGFVTQFLHCLPRRSAVDVVAEPALQRGSTLDHARDAAAELLEAFAVPEHLWHLSPSTFSGGEQQRVNLARGLIARPRLLLLDEPTASLDPHTTDRVVARLCEARDTGIAMLAIFHQPQLVDALADDVVQLAVPLSDSSSSPFPLVQETVR